MRNQFTIQVDRELGIVPQRVSIERENTITWNGVVYHHTMIADDVVCCDIVSGDDLRAALENAKLHRVEFRYDHVQAHTDFGGVRFYLYFEQWWMQSPIPVSMCPESAEYIMWKWRARDVTYTNNIFLFVNGTDVEWPGIRELIELGFHLDIWGERCSAIFQGRR